MKMNFNLSGTRITCKPNSVNGKFGANGWWGRAAECHLRERYYNRTSDCSKSFTFGLPLL